MRATRHGRCLRRSRAITCTPTRPDTPQSRRPSRSTCSTDLQRDITIELRVARTIGVSHPPSPRSDTTPYAPSRVPAASATEGMSLLRPRVRGATSRPAVSVVRGGPPPYTLSACWPRVVVNCCQVNDFKIRQRDAGLFSRRTSTLGSTGHVRRPKTPPRGSGGTGRRTSLRGWRSQERVGSNPPFRTTAHYLDFSAIEVHVRSLQSAEFRLSHRSVHSRTVASLTL